MSDTPLTDLFGNETSEGSEATSAQVASTAARLLGAANPLMRGSPYHPAVLQAIKDSALKADAKTLDLIEELAKVIEPFMRDVRTVAGSALTQFEPVVADPERRLLGDE